MKRCGSILNGLTVENVDDNAGWFGAGWDAGVVAGIGRYGIAYE